VGFPRMRRQRHRKQSPRYRAKGRYLTEEDIAEIALGGPSDEQQSQLLGDGSVMLAVNALTGEGG
jgi:hypothetical protein